MNNDMNEYLMEVIARDRLAEARECAAGQRLARQYRRGRTTYSIGVACIRVGIWLLARYEERFGERSRAVNWGHAR